MATVYSTVATIENAPTPSTAMEAGEVRGKIRSITGSYTYNTTASGTVVNLCKLYKGDQVKLGGSWIGSEDALGSGCTIAIGDTDDTDTADADRYLVATDVAAAGDIVQFNDVATCFTKVPYTIQKECWLTATDAGHATVVGDLRFEVFISNNS